MIICIALKNVKQKHYVGALSVVKNVKKLFLQINIGFIYNIYNYS